MSTDVSYRDFVRSHWKPISILGLSIIFFAVMYWLNYQTKQEKIRVENYYQTQVQTNLEAARSLSILQMQYKTYRQFVEKGVIGHAKRLQHFELIQALGNQLNIPSVLFSVQPSQYATGSNYYIWDEMVHLQYSVMHLNLTLRHEGQFQQFMDGLSENANGIYSMQKCDLSKARDQAKPMEYSELKAICELHWYTLKDITQSWGGDELVQN